jgi:hypothetical protein
MLINTVILLLRNGLPIFIVVSLLFLLLPKQRSWLWQGLLSGSTGVIVLYFLIAPITRMYAFVSDIFFGQYTAIETAERF